MKPRNGSRGFTLVEMLVSITILSLVMLATVTGLRTLASTQTSLMAVTTRNDEMRSVSSFLRDALEAAVAGSDSGGLSLGGGRNEATIFQISRDSILWRTSLLFGEIAGGSYVVRVAREDSRVVLRWQLLDAKGEVGDWNNAPSRPLVENVQEFSVAYRREWDGAWKSSWDERGLPGWVRLNLQAGGRYWPEMILAVAQ